jgi:cytoskeletal protein RodZ
MVTFAVCSLVTFVFWWQDEQLWQETRKMEQEPTPVVGSSLSSLVTHEPIIPQSIQSQQEHLSFDDNDFDLLETYTQEITQRVEAVYPLVDREHVHKIVWTVMVELFCKHGDPFARTAPTPVIAEKIARAV